jgi:WD40 repeat protein
MKRLSGHQPNDGVISAASPDGHFIASVASDGRVLLYARNTGWRPRRLPVHGDGQAVDVAFSSDGRRLLAIFVGRSDLYDLPSGRRIGHFHGFPVVYSADLSEALVTRKDGEHLVALPSGASLARLPGGIPSALAPRGDLAVTTSGARVSVWDTDTHGVRAVLTAPADVKSVTFSADGTRILTTHSDGSAAVWKAANGHQEVLLVAHTGLVEQAGFNADGSLVALAASGTVRVFDAATGVALGEFGTGGTDGISSLSFGGDRHDLILAGHRQVGTVALIECAICRSVPELVQLASTRVTRDFSEVERERYLHDAT